MGILVLLYLCVLFLKYYTLYWTLLNSNRNIHEQMVNGIVRSPGAFFDVTPSGVLINKFSNDLGILDNSLAICLIDTLEGPTSIVIAMVNIAQIYLYFIPAVVVILLIAILFFNYARAVIVQCKQMDLKNKNPIFQSYTETISGLVQIKTYNRRRSLIHQFSQIMNRSTKAAISFDLVSRGFGFYEAFIGLVLIFVGMNIGVSQSGSTSNGLFGVSLIFLFNFGDLFQWFLRQIITTESLMISYERANQITGLAPEKELRTDYDRRAGLEEEVAAAEEDRDVHTVWPEEPSLEFKNLSARYKPGLPLVIKDLSFTVEKHSKVGIVGRTGAGKSSIIQAIFRIIEPELGSQYVIGTHDALEMGLHSLRQHVSVIPQTPFLFKGSVKQNVDPFSTASDEQIWAVLQESGLYEHVQSVLGFLFSCPRSSRPTSRTLRSPSRSARSSCCASRGPSCAGIGSSCWTRRPRTWTWRPTASSRPSSRRSSATRQSSPSPTGSTPLPTTTRSSSCRRAESSKWALPTN